ncbi:DUF6341 family protein [Mesonia maritima]|uniref:Uracil phosphoribosyltransferase n=1 Tax=Mesonia maritima TaxID=1793873 RepID=A0ABU1K2J6_9FLAO|nr:uracil phosphoribosyltransferase [Mesonia maritima]MDR6299825.1 hypothetical protein [Mesonia maritima]
MKDFLELIQSLFEDVLFIPYDALRELELESWFAANAVNIIFILIGIVAFSYWVKQLRTYADEEHERQEKYYGKYWN